MRLSILSRTNNRASRLRGAVVEMVAEEATAVEEATGVDVAEEVAVAEAGDAVIEQLWRLEERIISIGSARHARNTLWCPRNAQTTSRDNHLQ